MHLGILDLHFFKQTAKYINIWPNFRNPDRNRIQPDIRSVQLYLTEISLFIPFGYNIQKYQNIMVVII